MSLLNEALRKKRLEQQPVKFSPGVPRPQPALRSRRKRQWIIVACALVASAAACGALFYWTASDDPVNFATAQFPPDDVKPHVDDRAAMQAPLTLTSGSPAQTPTFPVAASEAIKPAVQMTSRPKPSKVAQAPSSKPTPMVMEKSNSRNQNEDRPNHTRPQQASPITIGSAKAGVAGAGIDTVSGRSRCEPLYQKARQYHRRDHLDQAIALYLEVIKIDPDHRKALFNLAAAYLASGAYTKADPIIADLYLKEPANQQVILNLAIARIGCGRYHDALNLLDQAAERPAAPLFEIAFHKAVAYSRLNRARDAMDWYKRAETLRADDPQLLFNLAVVNDQQQHYAEAVDYYRKYLNHSQEIDAIREKQIRRRIHILQAYQDEQNLKESTQP